MIKTEQILKNERIRVNEYLLPRTEPELLRIIDDEMIRKSYDILIRDDKSGCKVLLANDKIEDLEIMFKLFHRIGDDGIKDMAKIFENYVLSQGHELLNQRADRIKGKDKSHDPEFVKALLALHKKYSNLLQDTFRNHPCFDMSLKNSFEDFINEKVGETKNLVLLSSYCDALLKKVDGNLEESLKNISQLFLYLCEKDRFVDEYRNQLAKRLLSHNPTSPDDEKIMIIELKHQCGAEFTSKLEGMLQDFELGSKIRSEFNRREHAGRDSVDFAAHVISPNHWPAHETPDVTIPSMITEQFIDVFTAWYEDINNGNRHLKWIHSVGSVTIEAVYGRKKYTLLVMPLQAIVLNALNDGRSISFTKLGEELNIDGAILKPVLHSLCCAKHKLVSKVPNNKKIDKGDHFVANSGFKAEKRKILIPMPSLTKSSNSRNVEQNRKYIMEAAVVRIMKARRTMRHQQLLAEVLRQLVFFKPNSRDIRKVIESLIEREYLERSEDGQSYNVRQINGSHE